MIFDINELILNTKDYDFVPFAHQGFGGRTKYIATPKKSGLPKLLIKHKGEFAPPCNSFVYGRIGQLSDVRTPKTYMMNVAKNDKHLFESPCVVGIEFIDGLVPPDMQTIKGNKTLEKEFVDCFTLFALFTEFEDNLQCAYVPNQAVYPLDYDESFGLKNGTFHSILYDGDAAEVLVDNSLRAGLRHTLERYKKISIEMAAESLNVPTEYAMVFCLETLQRFCDLTEDEIASVTDALMEFFPPLLAAYYEEYISILQKKAAAYIAKNRISG